MAKRSPRAGNLLTRVADLINPGTGQWDRELVQSAFWSEDAAQILGIPVHPDMDDVPAWHFDPKGLFSVKSAYRVFCDDLQRNSSHDQAAGSSLNNGAEEAFWSAIWNLEGLGRLRHFLWRLAHNSLALCSNLNLRGVKVMDRCFLCGHVGEDGTWEPPVLSLQSGEGSMEISWFGRYQMSAQSLYKRQGDS